ncbi:MAG: 16S/23S rRNA (cytidine-2'-O)-methyltransferase TlyA [Turneriella sp.]|nr:16S/23S rRNA (cytidine-2'-O)-methyltransferase TlyA [Turneriella sp.]
MTLLEALLAQKLVSTEKEGYGLILAGKVLVNDTPVTKPSTHIAKNSLIRLRGVKKYVSRAGEKLASALEAFQIPIQGRSFLDIGASTGGFTDVLLQHGAAHVTTVDVGKGLLHQKLRCDARIQVFEGVDFKKFSIQQIRIPIEAFVADVSFTSLNTIIKKAFSLLTPKNRHPEGIVLFKPQFELPKTERNLLDKGILRNKNRLEDLLKTFQENMQSLNICLKHLAPAAIKGTKGNQEYVAHLVRE